MDQLVSVGIARWTDDVDKLVEALGTRSETDPKVLDRLFETGAVSNFERVVNWIAEAEL
jgi:exoribonuclease R